MGKLYEDIISRDATNREANEKILSAYDKMLMEMRMTFIDAVKILAKGGGEDESWELAKKDQGLKKGTTKEEWLNFAYASQAYKKFKKGK